MIGILSINKNLSFNVGILLLLSEAYNSLN